MVRNLLGLDSDVHLSLGQFLDDSHLLRGFQGVLSNIQSMLTSQPKLLSVKSTGLGCSHGYRLHAAGCRKYSTIKQKMLILQLKVTLHFLFSSVICPAGTMSKEGACPMCPQGTYQDQEGREICHSCPRGSSPAGATSVNQCKSVSRSTQRSSSSRSTAVLQYNCCSTRAVVLPVDMTDTHSLGVFPSFRCDRLSAEGAALFRRR